MEIVHSFEACQKNNLRPAAVAMGMFDGLHAGHRAVIAAAAEKAKQAGGSCMVLTFSHHPMAGIDPCRVPAQLLQIKERNEILAQWGVSCILELSPTEDILHMSPETFLNTVKAVLSPSILAAGENFTFGYRGAGTMETLAKWCEAQGITLCRTPLERMDGGRPVSSTRIREEIQRGNLELARQLLGRPFRICGEVVHGDKRGRLIGFPTANVLIPASFAVPPDGVYAAQVHIDGSVWNGVANIGDNPTFANQYHRLEVFLLDFHQSIYGKYIRVDILKAIRPEERFSSVDALVEQMHRDVDAAAAYLKQYQE